MAGKNSGLGRGLGALLDGGLDNTDAAVSTLPISQVESCPGQPRKRFDEAADRKSVV